MGVLLGGVFLSRAQRKREPVKKNHEKVEERVRQPSGRKRRPWAASFLIRLSTRSTFVHGNITLLVGPVSFLTSRARSKREPKEPPPFKGPRAVGPLTVDM